MMRLGNRYALTLLRQVGTADRRVVRVCVAVQVERHRKVGLVNSIGEPAHGPRDRYCGFHPAEMLEDVFRSTRKALKVFDCKIEKEKRVFYELQPILIDDLCRPVKIVEC